MDRCGCSRVVPHLPGVKLTCCRQLGLGSLGEPAGNSSNDAGLALSALACQLQVHGARPARLGTRAGDGRDRRRRGRRAPWCSSSARPRLCSQEPKIIVRHDTSKLRWLGTQYGVPRRPPMRYMNGERVLLGGSAVLMAIGNSRESFAKNQDWLCANRGRLDGVLQILRYNSHY